MTLRKYLTLGLVFASIGAANLSAGAFPLIGKKKPEASPARKLTPAQNALIDKAIVREKEVIKVVKERAPLVEDYIQNMVPDKELLQVPESDMHFLGRVDFGKIIGDETYEAGKRNTGSGQKEKLTEKAGGFFKHSISYITGVGNSLHLQFHEAGFVQMILMDSNSFDRQHYNFGFVRYDFLGSIPTAVFDVTPIGGNSILTGDKRRGRFNGRIWIESRAGNVVRFNGDFAGSEKTISEFYHFDSWRTNVQDGLWLPTSFYVEESDPKSNSNTLKFKAINHIWGYVLKVPPKEASETDEELEGQAGEPTTEDVGPLGSQRAWVQQAEDNVVERLFQAGLIDAPSEFDKTLEAIAANILYYNNVTVSRPIRCRTLLTEPLESLAVGNTIIVSKSLIDTTSVPSDNSTLQIGNLNAIIAFQLAHIILGHRLDTKYAFNDRLLFPDTSAFKRIPMHHTDADNLEAAKKAVELLQPKELSAGQQAFGLYLAQLQKRVKALHALNEPMIGDGLTKSDNDNTFWLQSLVGKGDKLDMNNLKQQAAMPLSNFMRIDPWTDQVVQLKAPVEPILSSRDKLPFEVTPVYLKLAYYKPPPPPVDPNAAPAGAAAPAANGAAPDAGQQPAAAPAGNAQPANATPQPAPANATPPQQ